MTPEPRARSPFWRRALAVLLVGGAVVFLGLAIARNWHQLEAYDWSVRWLPLVASVVALAAVFGWGVVVWKLVLDRFDHPPVTLRPLLRIWFYSNAARYVPGKIWQLVGAGEMARRAGLSGPVVVTSMMATAAFSLLSAAVVAAVTLVPRAGALEGAVPVAAVVLIAAASFVLVHPRVMNRGLALVPRFLSRDVLRWRGSWADGLLMLGLSTFSWILYGAAFTLFVHSLVAVEPSAVVPLTGVNALSFLVGYVVFLAPAGVGARESAMAVLLGGLGPTAVVAVVAVLSRLWTIAAELLGIVVVSVLARDRGGRGEP